MFLILLFIAALDVGDTDSGLHSTQIYDNDDVRVEYHPSSGRRAEVFKSNKYPPLAPEGSTIVEPEPWAPFRTREDFEFAEAVLDAGMNKKQMAALIKLFHKCIKGDGSFTISSPKDLLDMLNVAGNRLTKV